MDTVEIKFTNEQLLTLRSVVEEYTDILYTSVLEYNKFAASADDELVKKMYLNYAADEEEKYDEVRALRGYLSQYEVQLPKEE